MIIKIWKEQDLQLVRELPKEVKEFIKRKYTDFSRRVWRRKDGKKNSLEDS